VTARAAATVIVILTGGVVACGGSAEAEQRATSASPYDAFTYDWREATASQKRSRRWRLN
jgi:hypothetical protein